MVGLFSGIAVLAAAIRLPIRLFIHRELHLDDYCLLMACAALITATSLLYDGTRLIFLAGELTINPTAVLSTGLSLTDIDREIVKYQKISWTYLAISWTSTFSVKFGFLSLFKQLLDRIPSLYTYWKGVVVFTAVAFAFALCNAIIACPHVGLAAGKHSHFQSLSVF